MCIEGNTIAWMLFLLGFLSCGLLSLLAWGVYGVLALRGIRRRLEELLAKQDPEE